MLNKTASRAAVVGMAAFAGLLILPGCGGSGAFRSQGGGGQSAVASRARGTVGIALTWPAVTRVVPISSQSVKITLTRTPASVQPIPAQVLTRPDPTQAVVSRASFTNLEVGQYTVTATAHPNPDGTGTPQAQATATITVNPGNNALALTMDATIRSLSLALATTGQNNFRVGVGQARQLVATAYDNPTPGSGNVVLTRRDLGGGSTVSAIQWTSSNPAVATVDQNGVITTLTPGTTTITVNYIEPSVTPGQQGTGATATSNVTVVPVGLASSTWSKFRGDLQNTGRALSGAATTGTANTFTIPGGGRVELSSPAVFSQGGLTTVYVGAEDGFLYAFRDQGGTLTLLWRFQTGGPVGSSPAIGPDGTAYFGSDDNNVYAVDVNGNQIWKQPTGGAVHGSPTISPTGIVYVGSYDGNLYAFDQVNGVPLAVVPVQTGNGVPGGVQGAPALSPDGSVLYVGSFDNNLYAFDIVNGPPFSLTPRWVFPTQDVIFGSPAVTPDGGTIYIGSFDGRLYSVSSAGTQNWARDINAPIYSSPAIAADGTVYVASFDNFSGNDENRVYAVDPVTSSIIKQSAKFGGGITSSPAIGANGFVYVGAYDNNIYGINFPSVPGNAAAPPVVVQTWTVSTGDKVDSSPAIGADGTVYIGGFDGKMYTIK